MINTMLSPQAPTREIRARPSHWHCYGSRVAVRTTIIRRKNGFVMRSRCPQAVRIAVHNPKSMNVT
jgi:hypothetical protein